MSSTRLQAYPRKGTIQIPDGHTYVYVVPLSTFLNVTSADRTFIIRVDDTYEIIGKSNKRYTFDDEVAFKKVEIINDSGAALNVQLEIGGGGVESDDVSISGTIDVKTHGGATRNHTVKTVGTSATLILTENAARTGWETYNNGTDTIYIGSDDTVSVSNGRPVFPGASYGLDDQDAVWAISATTGQDVRAGEVY